ncbi:MAG: hypothetical protein ACREHD_13555, partial [Pirellulales bacterium]
MLYQPDGKIAARWRCFYQVVRLLLITILSLAVNTAWAQGNAVPAAPPPPAAGAAPAATAPANPAAPPATPAASAPPAQTAPAGPAVSTVYDERLAAKVTGIEDGKLVVATEPVRKIPLDEVASVDFGNTPDLAAEWVGQTNHDTVQVGGAAGGNGIQDVLIRLRGLVDGKNIKQIVALTRGGKGRGIWR